MWIQVRTFDGKKSKQVDNLSKLTKIEDLRERLVEHFDAPAENQRLFYRGKQLVDGHSLFDYNVGLNDLIQLMVRAPDLKKADTSDTEDSSDKENQKPESPAPEKEEDVDVLDLGESTYKVGDVIDARDESMGAWFEAQIMRVTVAKKSTSKTNPCDTPKDKVKAVLTETSVKPAVLTETSLKPLADKTEQNEKDGDSSKKIDENSNNNNVSSMETEEASTSVDNKTDIADSYSKVFEIHEHDGYTYHMIYEGYEEDDQVALECKGLRPRARTNIKFKDIEVGDRVMANFNIEEPDDRGFWYDCQISAKQDTRTVKTLKATVYFGPDLSPLENCKLLYIDEIFAIEKPGTQLTAEDLKNNPSMSPVKRTNKPDCDHCLDNPRRKCKHCACSVCGGKHDPEKQILCDECNKAYHLGCLTPKLDALPTEDEWYCPDCKIDDKEIVKAGEKLKESKKKSKMASNTNNSNRDWGRGMACQGRQKTCTVVPTNHVGPVPGVEVGTMWKFRVQVSESGIHRPHVAGIAGRESEGAFSIVLSGGYEDDTDNGDTFLYTGSGGRDLSGNKRTAEQSCDQTLTRMNRALAKNCNATIDPKNGATAKDWKAGKPVRVVRNVKLAKHSEYAPDEGNRYDGIYKVVRYWPEAGKSGFLVWRFMLQRDDPAPAPWTSEGKKRSKKLGFVMQYPDGYLEAQAQKEKEKEEAAENTPKSAKKGKRKRKDSDEESDPEASSPTKKSKVAKYTIEEEQRKLIKEDQGNKKLWDEVMVFTKEGGQKFLGKVEEMFTCVCCQDLVYKPVSTPCNHNICKSCLQRSFKADVFCCPACRIDLGKDFGMPLNKPLSQVLLAFFPGYEAGR